MNKTLLTVSQVFVAINGVVVLIYGIVFLAIFNAYTEALPLNIIGFVLLLIASLYVVIFIRMGQAKDNPYMKTEVIVWGILLMVTGNLLAGLFGLIGALSEGNGQSQSGQDSLEKRLKDLDNLFDRGLITLDEYHERRKRIIESA